MYDNDKLSKFGYAFQSKLLSCTITDASFMSQIVDLVDPDYFETKSFKWIFEKIFLYFKEYRKTPTAEVLKIYTDKLDDELFREEVLSNLRDAISYIGSSDLSFIKNETVNFCKNQKLRSAILESIEDIKTGDYERIKLRIDSVFKLGQTNDFGLEYLIDIDKRYDEESRTPIETGWDVLDSLMKGGLSYGELGVLIAPSGIGKSWFLMNIAAHSLRLKKTVVYYTMELNESYCGIRFDSILSGMPIDKLSLHRERIKETLSSMEGTLFIKWFAQKSISYLGIQAHLEKMKLNGINPDLVIIDYADLLKYTGKSEKDDIQYKEIYESLRGMAGELKLPIWTVSQANRSALEESEIGAEKISGAYSKVFTADFVASLSRKSQDKQSNTARLHIIKNRFGPDGLTFPVTMDTSIGYIDIHSRASEEGKKTIQKMKSDEQFTKDIIKKRFDLNSKF